MKKNVYIKNTDNKNLFIRRHKNTASQVFHDLHKSKNIRIA